jgi:hypothetical protein
MNCFIVTVGMPGEDLLLSWENITFLFGCVLLFRIAKTPLPFSYFVHLRTMIALYLFVVPFAVAGNDFGLDLTIFSQLAATFFLSYTILGVEQCALKLEAPYGLSASSLPQEEYCNLIFAKLTSTLDMHADSLDSSLVFDLEADYFNDSPRDSMDSPLGSDSSKESGRELEGRAGVGKELATRLEETQHGKPHRKQTGAAEI